MGPQKNHDVDGNDRHRNHRPAPAFIAFMAKRNKHGDPSPAQSPGFVHFSLEAGPTHQSLIPVPYGNQ
jgi:hypothetical protein